MDPFQSHQMCQAVAILHLLPYIPMSQVISKTTGWFTKGAEIDPNSPHANKVLLKVAHASIYIDGLLSANTAQAVKYLTFFHIPHSIGLVKRLAGLPKGLN
jgi:hypothetical protein